MESVFYGLKTLKLNIMTKEEKEILEATKEFAEIHNIPYDNRIESMILNAMREVVKNCSIPNVSARLSSSLGECVEGNDYEIVADKDGRFWINHKEVGSGEPLEQWIDGVLNVR